MRFETLAIHAGERPDKAFGAISVPIYQTSTFAFEDVGKTRGYNYSRTANPTRKVLEDTIAQLEGGKAGFAFTTGMAAETTVMHLLKTGDHVIAGDDIYGGTYRLFQNVMRDFGLEFTFLRMDSRQRIEEAIKPNTRMLWLETPSNPLLNIVDIEMVTDIAKKHNLLTVMVVLRGIETLPVRMKQHEENAFAIANYLKRHPAVKKVYYPGLKSHPGHEIAKRQMKGFGGMVSFEINGGITRVNAFLKRIKIFALAESLGGVASLADHAATMTHASMPEEARKEAGITDELIRLSVGLENIDDLIEDLRQALEPS